VDASKEIREAIDREWLEILPRLLDYAFRCSGSQTHAIELVDDTWLALVLSTRSCAPGARRRHATRWRSSATRSARHLAQAGIDLAGEKTRARAKGAALGVPGKIGPLRRPRAAVLLVAIVIPAALLFFLGRAPDPGIADRPTASPAPSPMVVDAAAD
jgi:hypothetical protein